MLHVLRTEDSFANDELLAYMVYKNYLYDGSITHNSLNNEGHQ